MQRRKIPSLITTRCAGWHRAGGIHPRRRANRRPDNRDLDHPCRPRRRHQMEGPGTASNAAPALAILRALRQDGSRPRSQKQDLSGSRKSGSQWTRRWRRQSAANSSRKWSSESQVFGTPTGSWTLFPRRSAYLSDCYYEYFSNPGIAMMAALPVYKKRGGSTRSNLFKSQAF